MPQLDPTWFASQLFWLTVSFVALYFILSRLVLPPLQEVILRRQQTRDHDLDRAQTLKSEAEEAKLAYERTLAEARARAQQLTHDAIASHKAKAEAQMKDADRQIERKLADAAHKITAKKEEMMRELTPTAAELTAIIFEKLTQRAPESGHVSRILTELSKGRR